MFRLLLVGCAAASLLPAQDPIPAKAFLLDDYRIVAFADCKALRDRGIWDDLEVSLLKLAFQQMEKEIGFPLKALDRVTMVAEPPVEGGMGVTVRQVCVMEGKAKLGAPDSVTRGSWSKEKFGACEVWRRAGARDETYACPRPEMQVFGTTDILQPVLEGKPNAGQPCADVMSLLSGRGDNLAYLAVDVSGPLLRKTVLQRLFGEAAWPEGDEPAFVLLRLRATGEADDPHLEVEAVIRHAKAAEGLAATEKLVEVWLEKTQKDPQFRALKPLWPGLQRKKDRTDLTLRLDLGRSRDAIGYVALLMAPILRPVEAVEATEVRVTAPAPATEPKKDQ